MTRNQFKIFVAALLILPMLALTAFRTNSVSAGSRVTDDPAAAYKAKCAVCHSPKAEKFFDPAKSDELLTDIVLKGKKGEKPPYMPGFEAKGMNLDEAKALVGYMKSIRSASN